MGLFPFTLWHSLKVGPEIKSPLHYVVKSRLHTIIKHENIINIYISFLKILQGLEL